MNKTRFVTQGVRVVLAGFLIMVLSFSILPKTVSAAGYLEFDISLGPVTIEKGTTTGIKVTHGAGSTVNDNLGPSIALSIVRSLSAVSAHPISVSGDMTYTIILNDVEIEPTTTNAAFSIGTNSKVNLTLNGINKLTSPSTFAGLSVDPAGTLVISGDGSLTATGGDSGAGIGGNDGLGGGDITIKSGTIEAIGGLNAAGIGGGFNGVAANTKISISDSAYIKSAKGGNAITTRGGGAGIGTGGTEISVPLTPDAGKIKISSGVNLANISGGAAATGSTAGEKIGSGGVLGAAAATSYTLHTITYHDNKDPNTTQALTYTVNASASDAILPTLAFVQLHNSTFAPTAFDNYWYEDALGARGHEMSKALTDPAILNLYAFGQEPFVPEPKMGL